jgi:hypothetical protein
MASITPEFFVMRVSIPVLCGLIALFSCTGALAAKIYKWTDEKGITHFSEHPPLNTKTTRVKPQIALGEENAESSVEASAPAGGKASSASSSRQSTAEERAAARAAAKRDPERCAAAKDNVNTLKTYAHIKVKEGEEYRYLTPEEQQQKLAESTKAMNESCEPGTLPPAEDQQ